MIDKFTSYIPDSSVLGDRLSVKTTHQRHFTDDMRTLASDAPESMPEDFFSLVKQSLTDVNDKQRQASKLTQLSITNPEQVEIHDVLIAKEKAKLALNMTKTIRDAVIKAYKDITNLQ